MEGISVVSRGGEDMATHKWHQEVCGVMELFCVLIVVVAALWIYVCIELYIKKRGQLYFMLIF